MFRSAIFFFVLLGLSLLLPAATGTGKEPSVDEGSQQVVLVIDVRSREEWEAGHLEDAVWIPWRKIEAGLVSLGVSKDQPVALYCEWGVRAGYAEQKMREAGFSRIRNLISLENAAKITGQKIIR